MKDKQFAKLIKKTVAKAEQVAKKRPGKNYDDTLNRRRQEGDGDVEREQLFDEMKRREF